MLDGCNGSPGFVRRGSGRVGFTCNVGGMGRLLRRARSVLRRRADAIVTGSRRGRCGDSSTGRGGGLDGAGVAARSVSGVERLHPRRGGRAREWEPPAPVPTRPASAVPVGAGGQGRRPARLDPRFLGEAGMPMGPFGSASRGPNRSAWAGHDPWFHGKPRRLVRALDMGRTGLVPRAVTTWQSWTGHRPVQPDPTVERRTDRVGVDCHLAKIQRSGTLPDRWRSRSASCSCFELAAVLLVRNVERPRVGDRGEAGGVTQQAVASERR